MNWVVWTTDCFLQKWKERVYYLYCLSIPTERFLVDAFCMHSFLFILKLRKSWIICHAWCIYYCVFVLLICFSFLVLILRNVCAKFCWNSSSMCCWHRILSMVFAQELGMWFLKRVDTMQLVCELLLLILSFGVEIWCRLLFLLLPLFEYISV